MVTGAPPAAPSRTAPAASSPAPPVREHDFPTLPPRRDGTIRRAPAITSTAGQPSTAEQPSGETETALDWQTLVDRVVDALEDRVLRELERRGGRFLGEF